MSGYLHDTRLGRAGVANGQGVRSSNKKKREGVGCGGWLVGWIEGRGGKGVATVPASWMEVGTIKVIHSRRSGPCNHGEGSEARSRER